MAPETLGVPIDLPPTFSAKLPPGTVAVPEQVPLIASPGEGWVARQKALSSPAVFFAESCSTDENANPLPGLRLFPLGFPMMPKLCPLSPPGSVSLTLDPTAGD
jgi:hypothetical protein